VSDDLPKRAAFFSRDLRLVARAPAPDEPVLTIGDFCELLSGSPELLVVDVNGDMLTVAWRLKCNGKPFEMTIPRACVRRVTAT
jgi:hypothetical protein